MPRAPQIRTPALADLAAQARFQPPEAARRQLQRAEDLVLQLLQEPADAGPFWPVEWVIFRVTGYRPDRAADATIGRDDLLHDLGGLIHALSRASRTTDAHLLEAEPGAWLTTGQLCARWRVSRRTLERYRPLGLIARRVLPEARAAGRRAPARSLYPLRAVEAFERARAPELAEAAAFSRIDARLAAHLHRRAARYRARLGWSLARCVARLAGRFARSPGAVRRAVLAHDAALPRPLFATRRSRPSRATFYRLAAGQRAARLRALRLHARADALAATPAAQTRLLAAQAVTTGLSRPLPTTIAELLEQAAPTEPPAQWERAVAGAYALLRAQAAAAIAGLPRRSPRVLGDKPDGEGGIDWIETRLRWAARLKAELVRAGLGLALRTVESRAHRSIAAMPPAHAAELTGALLAALADAADVFDPSKGGRLAAPAGLSLNRAVTRWLEAHAGHAAHGRALPRPDPAHVRIDDPWPTLTPWNAWLEVPTAARAKIDTLRGVERDVLLVRMGWDARPPRTVLQAAAELGVSTMLVLRAEKRALRGLM